VRNNILNYSCTNHIFQEYFHRASNHTQFMLNNMITDFAFVDKYLPINKQNLRTAYQQVTAVFVNNGIHFVQDTGGGFFLKLINLRAYLSSDNWAGETELHTFIRDECRVVRFHSFFLFLNLLIFYKSLTKGAGMHVMEPGWFRVCFAKYHN
jgi:hypothetical protein